MVSCKIVPSSVPRRSPERRYPGFRQKIGGFAMMATIAQLESDVMKAVLIRLDDDDDMVIVTARHECRELFEPIGYLQAECVTVELDHLVGVRCHDRQVSKANRTDTAAGKTRPRHRHRVKQLDRKAAGWRDLDQLFTTGRRT